MKAAFIVASAVGLIGLTLNSAQAASFEFTLENANPDLPPGTLSFDDSPLTGIGMETVELSQLENANFFLQATALPVFIVPVDVIFANNEATFSFNDGELTGIFSESSAFFEGSSSGGSAGVTIDVTYNFELQGDTYQQFVTGTQSFSGFDAQTGEFFDEIITFNNELEASGKIFFTTIEPVAAIPEPVTVLGTATALGFGTFFKRKLHRHSGSSYR